MKSLSAAEAKNAFGHLIDLARHEPVLIEKHNRPVVVVISIEEFDRLSGGVFSRSQADSAQSGEIRADQ
jgi:prevent-host-death family protein